MSSLSSYLRLTQAFNGEKVSLTKLQGDASTREYYRVRYEDGASVVAMVLPNPGTGEEKDFLAIQAYLADLGLPVPAVHCHDGRLGVLLIEDLGDELLQHKAEKAAAAELRALYTEAVDILCRMRTAVAANRGDLNAFTLGFDTEKLLWELEFFLEHYVRGLFRLSISPRALSALRAFFLEIAETLSAEPRVFTHRDYHCRNLMVYQAQLVMIDFQDARMGPAQYDLASLLRDSYFRLPAALVTALLNHYMAENKVADRAHFRFIFALMALQRNIKALGTFAFQTTVRGSNRYLESIPLTADYICENINKRSRFARYRHVVEDFITGPAGELRKNVGVNEAL